MDFSLGVAMVVYIALLILFVISVAHKTVKVIDLVQEIASHWKPERVPVKALDPEVFTLSQKQRQEHLSGQGS